MSRLKLIAFAVGILAGSSLQAQVNPALFSGMRWRGIGPFRAGRISAVTGVIGQPGVFYVGLPAGGVWKTDDAGTTWVPIFDDVKDVSSIGALEVAPSDANVLYAGTGDLVTGGAVNEGNGIYKSSDGGKSWVRSGLDDTHQIPSILVDPHNPDLVLAAAQGNINAKSDRGRGIYRSEDGGRTWKRVLVRDDETGIQKLAWAYDDPNVVFAMTVRHFTAPYAERAAATGQPDTGTVMYKSTDEGQTWQEVHGSGLPALTGRTSVAVAANTHGQRVFLIGTFGLYRSDDGGATWRKSTTDTRMTGSGYICDVYVDPKNPDVVYTMGTSMYRSTDGGVTFDALMGGPGGDDQHLLWIDPTNPNRLLMGSDQGATVSFNWGRTWSMWYNQPTGQFYHIAADNRFPYWVWGIMQDSCGIGTQARGDLGQITPNDWFPLPAWEFGNIAPDPLDKNVLWTNGQSNLVKLSTANWHWQNIGPIVGHTDYRKVTNAVLVFSPQDPHLLYFATQYVTATHDGGATWRNISPDLTARPDAAPVPAGGRGGAALESISPSPFKAGVVWAGSNNGLVHVTLDNATSWQNVSPPGLTPYDDLSTIEASHFDAATAYAAVDGHTGGDYAPYIYRTRDSGKTWQKIVAGLPTDEPTGSFVRVVREDPERRGLLFAGTESSMFVSFDDGDHWQSLRLNLPNTSYRDMVIHGDDLVVGTYGRSFWILDDITPLREVATAMATQPVHFYKPGTALRIMRDVNVADEITPDFPHALNPPEGAVFDYYFSAAPQGVVKLEVLDATGEIVRTLSSAAIPPLADPPPNLPDYWLRKPQPMPAELGGNRINWDLRYDPLPVLNHNFNSVMFAVYHDTPYTPEAPLVLPGTYTARLTVDGHAYTQTFTVKNDPRFGQDAAMMTALRAQFALERNIMRGIATSYNGVRAAESLRAQLRALSATQLPASTAELATALDAKLAPLQGQSGGRRGGGAAAAGAPSFSTLNASFASLISMVEGMADAAPNAPQEKAYRDYCADLNAVVAGWNAIQTQDLGALKLTAAPLTPLSCGGPPSN